MTHQEAVDEALTILLAGSDTTAAALTWSAYLLAKNLDTQQRLCAAHRQPVSETNAESNSDIVPVFQEAVFREAMQLFPPGVAIARQASESVEIGDYLLPKGALVFVSVYTIHHDSRWFEDPENFRPERFVAANETTDEFTYLPFGAGPRACIGRRLAMMEGQLVLTELLQRFQLQLPTPFTEPVLETQLSLHPKDGLVLQLNPI